MFGKSTQKAFAQSGMLDMTAASRQSAANLPVASASVFRKRPVKLQYDKNEFHMFRLPSENHFLLDQFDNKDIFGKKHGIQHSPAMLAQTQLDNRLLLGIAGIYFVMLLLEFNRHGKFQPLRENFRLVDQGKFSKEDFVEKKQ